MKNIVILLVVLTLITCQKKDTINHFLTKQITQQDLIKNGFYKYSYIATLDDEDKVDDTIKSIARYDMYSNVKPEINKEGKVCPTQLWNFDYEDSIKKKKNIDYLKKELGNTIITYLFRNDSLFYKEINVISFNNQNKNIPDLTSKEKILKYYHNINIPTKPLYEQNSTKNYPTIYKIDNYKTIIYYSDTDNYYRFFTNYLNNSTYYDIREYWYSGSIYEMYYFD
ncbi:hypothetical protein L1276_003019 [Flavobacterium sp. HSC-32F16]|uniref:hypothetical protein n=1 Tax=Flavobacterium sp. HSC-32F16 TaxID=2910964 RepID=UPI0020A59B60|nr:hypothetical protein [Flavobacterium sp. HSC-32F16]MCP2027859.1 hypothetical protein [Flavobacterium sp. HSC-32F16]